MSIGTEAGAGGAPAHVSDDGPPDEGGLRLRFVRESPRRVDPDLAGEVAARFQAARGGAQRGLTDQLDAAFTRWADI